MNKYIPLVGHFVLIFGSLETILENTIISIFAKNNPCNSTTYKENLEVFVKNNAFSTNLNYLRFFIDKYINEEYKEGWQLLIKDLDFLMQKRNLLVHQMYGVDDAELIKRKKAYQLKDFPVYIQISIDELDEWCDLLSERYRQLFDSVIEAEIYGTVTWISNYPQLYF